MPDSKPVSRLSYKPLSELKTAPEEWMEQIQARKELAKHYPPLMGDQFALECLTLLDWIEASQSKGDAS